ncbi:MAG: hypothetical protein HQM04_10820 [Magnetococcales bacterium]|nr:hypothetical protein [Magnetococcales bacterium]MBF0115516.1 hypothetical protein [Magnetococcales bacterium]
MNAEWSRDGTEIIVTIPMSLRRRSGRKSIIFPEGVELPSASARDETLAKLVAKAHLWLRQLESGKVTTISELAERENLDNSYVAKVMRLTLLAPDIVERILDGTQPDVMSWRELAKPFPVEWERQRERWRVG